MKLEDAIIGYVCDDEGCGPVFDCVKLAQIETEGIRLKDYPNHVITVQTKNSEYTFGPWNGTTAGNVCDNKTRTVKWLGVCNIHGSTWGGSMIKTGYIGIGMHLEFYCESRGLQITSEIQSVRTMEIE